MTSLAPACYLITAKQQWPLDVGLTPCRVKHLTHMIGLSSWTLVLEVAHLAGLEMVDWISLFYSSYFMRVFGRKD